MYRTMRASFLSPRLTLGLVLGVFALSGCGSSGSNGSPAGNPDSGGGGRPPGEEAGNPPGEEAGTEPPAGGLDCSEVPSVCSMNGDNAVIQGARVETIRGRTVTFYVPPGVSANPPLLIVSHGTGSTGPNGICESGADRLAQRAGVVLAAANARESIGKTNFDHYEDDGPGWDLENNSGNEDLSLVEAIVSHAQNTFGIDPARIHALGHSNGAFFTQLIAMRVPSIASFAESSGGVVPCANRGACTFQGTASSCSGLAAESGWAACASACQGAILPAELDLQRKPAGFLAHGAQDDIVSVYFTCRLASAMRASGFEVSENIRTGSGENREGHYLPDRFACDAWPFLDSHRKR